MVSGIERMSFAFTIIIKKIKITYTSLQFYLVTFLLELFSIIYFAVS